MKVVKLGEVCKLVNGDRGANYPSKSKQTDQGIPFINAGHLTGNGLDMDNMNYISLETFDKLGNGKIQPNDILFCLRGTLGKFASVGKLNKGAIASSLVIIRPDIARLLPEFLLLYFSSEDCIKMIEKFRNGTAQPNLSANSLAQFEIQLPAVGVQRRIVAKLDIAFGKIDRAIELTEKNIRASEQIIASELAHAFETNKDRSNWTTGRLDKFCVLQRGHDLPKSARTPGEYKLASSSGIIDTHTTFKAKGPGVFTGRSGSIGGVFYQHDDYWPLNTVLYVNEFYDNEPKLIYYLIKSLDFKKYAGGTGVPTLNRNNVHSIVVSLPPITEQPTLVSKLDKLSNMSVRLVDMYKNKKLNLNSLKQSMLKQAFSESGVK